MGQPGLAGPVGVHHVYLPAAVTRRMEDDAASTRGKRGRWCRQWRREWGGRWRNHWSREYFGRWLRHRRREPCGRWSEHWRRELGGCQQRRSGRSREGINGEGGNSCWWRCPRCGWFRRWDCRQRGDKGSGRRWARRGGSRGQAGRAGWPGRLSGGVLGAASTTGHEHHCYGDDRNHHPSQPDSHRKNWEAPVAGTLGEAEDLAVGDCPFLGYEKLLLAWSTVKVPFRTKGKGHRVIVFTFLLLDQGKGHW